MPVVKCGTLLILALAWLHSVQAFAQGSGRCSNADPRIAIPGCTALLARSDLPKNIRAMAFFQRGLAHFSLESRSDALSDFTSAIENDPNYALAYLNRSAVLQQLDRPEDALKDATSAIEI